MSMKYDIDVLIAARMKLGWTKKYLAKKVKVSRATITNLEKEVFQNPKLVEKVCRALGIEVPVIEVKANKGGV